MFDRIRQCLAPPAHENWKRLLLTRPEIALIIGLAPLDVSVTAEEASRYLDNGLTNGYLMLGCVHAEHPMRPPPRRALGTGTETAAPSQSSDEGKLR